MKITVVGTGYLGATHAACLAELGFDVLGLDTDRQRIARLAAGELPFHEPGLPELLAAHTASGRLQFTTDAVAAAAFGDVHFLCVGTPQRDDGLAADTGALFASLSALVPHLTREALLVGKSTVPVGTAQALAARARELAPPNAPVEIAWNPEFLREGHAVADTLQPDRLVFGVDSAEAEKNLRRLYHRLIDDGVPLLVTDVRTAELVKQSANAFLATKLSFINVVADLCDAAGADIVALVRALGLDKRIGPAFLATGLGFGGGCLPKDLRGLAARADELGVRQAVDLLRDVDEINMARRTKLVDLAVDACGGGVLGKRIAVLGAAFKPGTDDVRDSPALSVAAQLQLRGARIALYDPQANANAAASFPMLNVHDDVRSAARGADLVLHLTEWAEFDRLDPAELGEVVARRYLVDGRNSLDADRWRANRWTYRAIGRPDRGRP